MVANDFFTTILLMFYLIMIIGFLIVVPLVAIYGVRERKKTQALFRGQCPKCFYNLVGTLDADGSECPECGEPIRYKPGANQ